MMKIYICPQCGWMRMVSRRKNVDCHQCGKEEMKLTNLDLAKYAGMSEEERSDYATAWLYIHKRKGPA